MPRTEQPQFAIDLTKWKGKTPEVILEDLSTLGQEAKEGNFAERTNVAIICFEEFQKLVQTESPNPEDIATLCIYQWISQITPALAITLEDNNPQPEEILLHLSQRQINPKEIIIWLSPKVPRKYEESRAVIYFPVLVNQEKYLAYYAICGQENPEEYASIATKLLSSPISKKDINSYPIPIIVPENIHWTNFLETYFGYPEIWKAIRNNQVIENKIKTYFAARKIVNEHFALVQKVRKADLYQQIAIGREIELAMQRSLNITLLAGACGGLYSKVLDPSSLFGSRNIAIGNESSSSRRKHCGRCGKSGYFTEGESCPYDKRND